MTDGAVDIPPYRYTAGMAADIEACWQDYWSEHSTFYAPNPAGPLSDPNHPRAGAPKLYVMDMFPYPSGSGLHVGHPLGYIGTDCYTRYFRMAGYNVLHPMGFDAFGLPAEQYAVQTGTHPRITTEANVERYRGQLRRLGLAYDDRRSVATTDTEFYRWTQWIFLRIFNSWFDPGAQKARPISDLISAFESGARVVEDGRPWAELSPVERREVIDGFRLAYISEAPVNWCPGLGTVLANEEVTPDGRSERGNFPVFKRSLRQWMMRITAYGDRLLDDLERLDWPEKVKTMQRNWIGRSRGAHVDFATDGGAPIRVFTTRPDTLFGATYMVLAPEHELISSLVPAAWPADIPDVWTGGHATPGEAVAAYRLSAGAKSDVERQADAKEKTGVFTGAYAVNPVNGARIPVFIADYVLAGYGTGAIMAVPGQDERDWAFAEVFDLPIIRTVQPADGFDGKAYTGDGPAINSVSVSGLSLDGLGVTEAKAKIIDWLEAQGHGVGAITYRLRDWLFSRQRYWGEPFPIVYDATGLPIALPESMLPVELPEVEDFSPRTFDVDDADSMPETPLSRAKEWVEVTLDLGDGPQLYTRETNVMPQWAGSSWYELRYLDPSNKDELTSPENEKYWMGPQEPGDVGGVDLYVGGVEHAVLHLLYARFWHKVLFDLGHISSEEPFRKLFNQGYIQAYAFRNDRGTPVPAEEVQERAPGQYYYNDAKVTREYGKMGKSLKNVVTPDEMCERYGADTFRVYEMSMGPLDVSRPWETRAVVGAQRFLQRVWRLVIDEQTDATRVADVPLDEETRRLLHRVIAGVRVDIEEMRFNTAIAKLIELTNRVTQVSADGAPREVVDPLVRMVSPFAPHLAEELWQRLGNDSSIAYADFPVADEAFLVAETVKYPVQVNGKVRGTFEIAADAAEDAVREAALAEVEAQLAGKTPKKVIVIQGRMVSIVV
ncbi:leucine--tRNA ligase [Dactylosporangium sp. NPDC005555]|uniref:leucine--tRNA ligase n=1 Tax=Dactylosporangium sp. NPDC005555 TaxID=3154889 RepID=UPI0033BA0528